MPYKFSFTSHSNDVNFACMLECMQCAGKTKAGDDCKKRTCFGLPYCWMHLRKEFNVRIKKHELYGKGLFVDAPGGGNDIIFRKGDSIVEYGAEPVTKAIIDDRYGDYTAPYGLGNRRFTRVVDGACRRGPGTMANRPTSAAAAASAGVPGQSTRGNAKFAFRGGVWKLIATANIRNNKEVLVSYGGQYNMNEPVSHSTRYARN